MDKALSEKEINDIIQWDVKNWSKCLTFWKSNSDLNPKSKILALGERGGGISLYFALMGHEVVCSDYNPIPDSTKELHKSYSVDTLITYAKIDMRSINFDSDYFDVVVFKSVIGALGEEKDQLKASEEIYRVLKPGGHFYFAENLEGTFVHRFLRKKFVSWGKRWRYITKKEILSWNKSFKEVNTKSFGLISLFGRSEKQRRFLSGIDSILTPITPKKWRYILFGVFKK